MTLYKGNKVIAGSRSYIGNIGDIKYTARVDLPFGGSWCDGSIKLKAQFPTVYQMLIDGKLQALDIATYESALNLNGSCGFFGLDTATESFRVPSLNDVYIKSGQVADEFGAESLPNITGLAYSVNSSGGSGYYNKHEGAFGDGGTISSARYAAPSGASEVDAALSFDASRVSITYQNEAKVNPDHVKYRAYVVLYTGADTNIDITKEIQLNNPFFFGMSQYFEVDPKNASWLLSDGAFHSGAVYESFYNWLVSEYNSPDVLPRKVNADIVGNPTVQGSIAYNFTTTSYLQTQKTFPETPSSFEVLLRFKSSDVTIEGDITGSNSSANTDCVPEIRMKNSKIIVYIGKITSLSGVTTLQNDTWYNLRLSYNSSGYKLEMSKDGEDYAIEASNSVVTPVSGGVYFTVGSGYGDGSAANFNGVVDLSSTLVNIENKLWWCGYCNSVKTINESYSDYDYVINTDSNSFRLPIKTHLASGNAVVGNGTTLGLTNGNVESGLRYTLSSYPRLQGAQNSIGLDVGVIEDSSSSVFSADQMIGITTDATKSGIETSSSGLKLYFYVGDVVSDANLLNAGKVLDLLAKLESYDYVVESKVATAEDPNWYRVYKSGWVEQGGTRVAKNTWETITFLKPFINANYTALTSNSAGGTNANGIRNKTTVSMQIYQNWQYDWYACGQSA